VAERIERLRQIDKSLSDDREKKADDFLISYLHSNQLFLWRHL